MLAMEMMLSLYPSLYWKATSAMESSRLPDIYTTLSWMGVLARLSQVTNSRMPPA